MLFNFGFQVESAWATVTAFFHLLTEGVKTFEDASQIGCEARDSESVRFAGEKPGAMLGIPAINAAPAPAEAGLMRIDRNAIEKRPLHTLQTIFGKQETALAVGPSPAFGSVRGGGSGVGGPEFGGKLFGENLREGKVGMLSARTVGFAAKRDSGEFELCPRADNLSLRWGREGQHKSTAPGTEVQGR